MKKIHGFKKGVNLGGWLSQSSLEKDRLENFITKDDLKYIKEIGCDHVRLPVDYNLIENEDGSSIESGYDYIDRCVSWCSEYGLSMLLDLHKTYGYAFSDAKNCSSFFEDVAYQNRFLALWDKLALKYGKYDFVAFDLLNEIVDPNVTEIWNELAQKAIEHIRQYAPNNWILVGGVNYNHINSIKDLFIPTDNYVAYSFHFYEPHIFTHQGAGWEEQMKRDFRIEYPLTPIEVIKIANEKLDGAYNAIFEGMDTSLLGVEMFKIWFKEAVQISKERDIPLYCGEYGVINCADTVSTLNWISDINSVFVEYDIGRSIWSFKEMAFGIIDEHCKPIFDELIKVL